MLFESIKVIRNAQENNQLVILVGAGASKNSGMSSWVELVNAIATKIGYKSIDYCDNCENVIVIAQRMNAGICHIIHSMNIYAEQSTDRGMQELQRVVS